MEKKGVTPGDIIDAVAAATMYSGVPAERFT